MKIYNKYSWLLSRKMKDVYYDIITPFKKGNKWTYALTLKHQPKTAKILLNAPMAIIEKNDMFFLVQQIGEQYIKINRTAVGYNLSDEEFKIGTYLYPKMKELIQEDSRFLVFKNSRSRAHSLPMEIREAYYTRFTGFKYVIPSQGLSSILPCRYPADHRSEWNSIDGYLDTLGKKKEFLPWIEKYFPGKLTRHPNMLEEDYSYTGLMVFLDSRCNRVNTKHHFVLLVKTEIQDGIIYVIKDGDVKNMRILSSYVEAIDEYCSLGLQDKLNKFDIMKYTSDFIDPRTQHDKEVYENTQEEIDWWNNR